MTLLSIEEHLPLQAGEMAWPASKRRTHKRRAFTSLGRQGVSRVALHASRWVSPSLCRQGWEGWPTARPCFSAEGAPRLWCPAPRLSSSLFSPPSWGPGPGDQTGPSCLGGICRQWGCARSGWDNLRGDNCSKIIPLTPVLSLGAKG